MRSGESRFALNTFFTPVSFLELRLPKCCVFFQIELECSPLIFPAKSLIAVVGKKIIFPCKLIFLPHIDIHVSKFSETSP
jgi:hypothetical protein